ncbi:hypothetical protein HA466_0262300 [Hirschfeldia incana]|nr:hypothetical protein HA466_0262300 [Hirschfeldia incana]
MEMNSSSSLVSFSVEVSWAPRSRVRFLTRRLGPVLMRLRLCLRHCASDYPDCVSSFVGGSIFPPLPLILCDSRFIFLIMFGGSPSWISSEKTITMRRKELAE